MGGIMDMFSGSDGQGTQVVDTTPDEYAALRGSVADSLKNLIASLSGSVDSGTAKTDTSQYTADLTGDESALLSGLMEKSGTSSTSTDAVRQLLLDTIGGIYLPTGSNVTNPTITSSTGTTTGAAEGSTGNPYLDAMIETAQRPLIEQFQNEILPSLRTSYTAAGQTIQPGGSSPFEAAATDAANGLANSLGDIGTELAYNTYQSERGLQQDAASLLPQVESADIENTIAILQEEALPRLIEQYGIDVGIEQFNKQIEQLLSALGVGGGLSTGDVTTIEGTEGDDGVLGSLLSGAGSSAGSAAGSAAMTALISLFSDRRLKENIVRVGKLPVTGLPVYTFNYIWDKTPEIGVMADEVSEVAPELVGQRGGYATVNYVGLLERECA